MSVSSSSALPYRIPTTNEFTKIYKSPISFQEQHFLASATKWTKNRLLGEKESQVAVPSHAVDSSDAPVVTFGGDDNGQVVLAYENCVQVWNYNPDEDGGVFVFGGSTENISGKVISGTLLSTNKVVVQVSRRDTTELEVYKLGEGFEQKVVIPPSGAGSGPYTVHCPSGCDYFAVVAKTGEVALFGVEDYVPIDLSGLETTLGADNMPLLDIRGRWVAIAPKAASSISAHTTLKMPPAGPLHERIVESFSSTAAASLKSLSDYSVDGIKSYLVRDYKKTKNGIPLNQMINNLWDTNTNAVQIIDIPTKSTICNFTPLYGVSHLSLSPHDTTLATVSLNGDHVYTYDLSFVPAEVGVTGRYVRGKIPARVRKIVWDSFGGLGVITWEKGSLHWFDKRRSFDSTNKVWALSGWNIESGQFVSKGEDEAKMQLMLLIRGQVLIANVKDGVCTWKYDMPWGAVNRVESIKHEPNQKKGGRSDPLSNFELEPCLPFPFAHKDRRIIMSVYENEQDHFKLGKHSELAIFGKPIAVQNIEFGKPDGRAKFSPELEATSNSDEIRQAMESMVINDDTATIKSVKTNATASSGQGSLDLDFDIDEL